MNAYGYTVFDVETPNEQNNRMSSIGITLIDDGQITGSFSSLVNPETYFRPFNIALTGILPEEAEAAPSFDALWETIEPFFADRILVAHNAPFDLGVLGRCLRAYCLDFQRSVPYVCTVQMTRKLLPQLPDHRLNTLCAYWEIPLDHHRAESDSYAAAEILLRLMERGADPGRYLRVFDLAALKTIRPEGRWL
jgi:DNA polymerase-3 subunit epsilon